VGGGKKIQVRLLGLFLWLIPTGSVSHELFDLMKWLSGIEEVLHSRMIA